MGIDAETDPAVSQILYRMDLYAHSSSKARTFLNDPKLDEMIEDKEVTSKEDFGIIVSSMHKEIEGLKGALKEFHV